MSELEELNWPKPTDKQVTNLVPNIFLSASVVVAFFFNIE